MWRQQSWCQVLSGQKFVTKTRFLLCSYVEVLKHGCDSILYANV